MQNREVFICSAVRTPVGRFGGSLKDIAVSDLGSLVIANSIKRAGIPAEHVNEVIMGNSFPTDEEGGNPARVAAVKAGVPVEVPAFTVNKNCASSLRAVSLAAVLAASGEADIVVAGGMENMSKVPFVSGRTRWGQKLGHAQLADYLRLALTDPLANTDMGGTAENLAEKYQIAREEQDLWALMSQRRAEAAIKNNRFSDEIVPVSIRSKKGMVEFAIDEHPVYGTTLESLASLKPAFKQGGTVTAGNSSGLNDGAAALTIMSGDKVKELGLKPLAKVIASASTAVEPRLMGIAPVTATNKALGMAGMSLSEINLIECNEAFAAQILAVERELHWDRNIVNVNGGGISLGHPVGATGARLVVSLIYELIRRKERFGLATMCVGGGQGVALILENLVEGK